MQLDHAERLLLYIQAAVDQMQRAETMWARENDLTASTWVMTSEGLQVCVQGIGDFLVRASEVRRG